MSRLYEITYNKKQWSVKGSRDTGYRLVNKLSLDSYSITGDIIGIEQILDDTFLVYRRTMRDEWQIFRLKLNNGKKIIEYTHEFRNFYFLADDIIIFDKDSSHGAELYSISQNRENEDINHLISGTLDRHDCSFVKSRKIDLIYDKEESEYPFYLLVDYELDAFHCSEHLQVMLDANTLLPVTPVYSTLRDKYFTLNSSLTLRKLVEEENYYLYIIDDFLYKLYFSDNTKSLDELVAMIKK